MGFTQSSNLSPQSWFLKPLHVPHRPIQDGQRAQAQKVEFHQADRLDIILVELADHAGAAVGAIQRAKIGELAGRDQHAARVHPDVARQVFETLGELQQLWHAFLALRDTVDFRLHLARFFQRHRLHPFQRDRFGQAVAQSVGKIHHPPDIADHRLGSHGAEGGDLRHAGRAVFLLHIFDDALAPVLAEIHVEVRHGHALRIQETLEQQRVTQRIQIGDAEAVRHQRTRAGAASRADRHAVIFSP